MDEQTQEQLLGHLKTLPRDVQRAVLSTDTERFLNEISQKYELAATWQVTALKNETTLILLGIEHPRDYISNLARELEIDVAKARSIAQDVNEKIFRPVRDSLKQVHGIDGESGSRNQEVGIRNQENVYPVSRMEKRGPGANVQQTTDNLQQTTDMPAPAKGYGEAMQDTSHLIDHEGFHDERSAVNGQRSTVSGQRSAVSSHQPAVINNQRSSINGHPLSDISHQSMVSEAAPSNLPVMEDENALTHDQVLAELEYHSKAGKNIVEERLGGIFAIPSTKTEHKEVPVLKKESVEEAPEKKREYGADPYREHVE